MYLGFGFVRVPLHQFVLSQICYSEYCSSSLVDVGFVEPRKFLVFCVYFLLD